MAKYENLARSIRSKYEKYIQGRANDAGSVSGQNKPAEITYNDWGFDRARRLHGEPSDLIACLALIREDHKQMIRKDTKQQNEIKAPLVAERKLAEEQINHNNNLVERLNQENRELKNSIGAFREEIAHIKAHPEKIVPDKHNRASFVISLLIVAALTVYLFVFYSSASFSAFFKEFTATSLGVASSIFDPQAFSKAFQEGIAELILIVFMPFVFIGLGFLIHTFQKQKGTGKYFKIGLLILVTFVFDSILAYEITRKIYELTSANSLEVMPPYEFKNAFESVNFWLIIFAGFVVYIIWGIVFDYTMESYDKLNALKQVLKAKDMQIENAQVEYNKNKEKIDTIINDNNTLQKRIIELTEKVNSTVINTAEFKKMLHDFFDGWLEWMRNNRIAQEKIDMSHQKFAEFSEANLKIIETKSI